MYQRESLDGRIKNTRRSIQKSLFSLMSKKSYDSIKINEIARASGIARQTFYKHFKSKDEIIGDYIDSLFECHFIELKEQIKSGSMGPLSGAKISFEMWKREASAMSLLIESRLETMLLKPLRKYIDFVIDFHISERFIDSPDPRIYPHVVDFITGGYYMMLIDWIEKDCHLSEETMAALISEILSSTRSHESYFPKDINSDLKFRNLSES